MTLHVVDADTGEVVDRQVMPDLDTETRAALRESILRFGVMVPIVVDQDSHIIDGHNRWAIADELNVDCPSVAVTVESEADALAIAADLNLQRRHMPPEARRSLAQSLRERGHSLRAIAGAIGVDHTTVRNDLQVQGEVLDNSTPSTPPPEPDRVQGADGKEYPAKHRAEWTVDEVLALLDQAEAGVSRADLANEHGVGVKQVTALLGRARKIRSGDAPKESPLSRLNKASEQVRIGQITELAAEGRTSRQIADRLGITFEQVRAISKKNDINVPADKVVGKTRRIDSNRVLSGTVIALEAEVTAVGLIDLDALDPDQIEEWVSSLSSSLRALTRFHKQLKEKTLD